VTPPRTIGPFKDMRDIKADYLLDIKEGRYDAFYNASIAMRGSYGLTVEQAYHAIERWIHEVTKKELDHVG